MIYRDQFYLKYLKVKSYKKRKVPKCEIRAKIEALKLCQWKESDNNVNFGGLKCKLTIRCLIENGQQWKDSRDYILQALFEAYERTLYSTTEYTDYLPWCFEYFYGVRKKSQGDCMLIQAWRSLDTRGHTNSL